MNLKTLFSALCVLFGGLVTHGNAEEPFLLSLPVDCEIGKTCFVQNYVDHDPGPGRQDFQCRAMTYDGHEGTDFRVLSLVEQRAGVAVLAAADGVVLRTRDGEQDVSVRTIGAQMVAGRECGNAVVIDHDNGWQTQYCHMALNSVSVTPGQKLKRGAPIGRIGLSGKTEFPHLHLSVRLNGKIVDPFAPDAEPGQCGTKAGSMWRGELRDALGYRTRIVLNKGFADRPIEANQIETGSVAAQTPSSDSAALVAYVRVIGLEAGDVQTLKIRRPDGTVLVENTTEPLTKPFAQQMLFVGHRKPANGWSKGTYEASYSVRRDGQTVSEDVFSIKF